MIYGPDDRPIVPVSFWIEGTDRHGPHGFGVTAWSVEDAFALIESAGFSIDSKLAVIHENVLPHQVGYHHVALNAGPAVFRGGLVSLP